MRTFLSVTIVLISFGIRAEAQGWDEFVRCHDTFRKGSGLHYETSKRKGADVTNLEKAIPILDTATVVCKGQHFEASAWHSLANALFFTGNWSRAENAYAKLITMYTHPAITEILGILRACQKDEKMESLRLGNVHELHKDLRTALSFYIKTSSSSCALLAKHGQKEVDRVRKILTASLQRTRPKTGPFHCLSQ